MAVAAKKRGATKLERVRNIGFIAHIDAGKTTTTERVLFYAGVTHRIGSVDSGTTEMDWMEEEKERGITITSAATACFWRDFQVNIIDTPGHVDFTAEVERSLRVLDGAVPIFSAVEGVESQSEKVWRQADRYHIPRIAFINKLDRSGANHSKVCDSIRDRLGATLLLLQIPYGEGDMFKGIIDLLSMKLLVWDEADQGMTFETLDIPEDAMDAAKAAREGLLEHLAEVDDELMLKFINEEEIPLEQLQKAVRVACLEKRYVPVMTGSSLKNVGVQALLDAIIEYLPSPLDVPPVEGTWVDDQTDGKGEEHAHEVRIRKPDRDEPFAALAFKVVNDEYMGRLVYARIYSGVAEKGSYVFNSTKGKQERIARIFHMHANSRVEIESAAAGDIVALVGPKELTTGHTICDAKNPVLLESIDFPEPVVSLAVEPRTQAEEAKLTESLVKLAQEDPTFRFRVDPETNQTIVSGMGELHLEILTSRLKREFNVEPNIGAPQVAYRETLSAPADVEEKFSKQSGGRGQFAHVYIRFEPLGRGQGFVFEDEIKGGVIPKTFIPSVRKGLEESIKSGPLAGYPIVDLKAVLYDGSYHDVDSSEIAFKIAATNALREAFRQVQVALLEPIMEGYIITPNDYVGDIMEDISSRRGLVKGFELEGTTQTIEVRVPLSETFGYTNRLRSLSQGRATADLHFSHYEVVPVRIREEILEGR
jgi:elongation factor G